MDTNALQQLVAKGGVVSLPRQTFQVDNPIRLRSGTVIEGSGTVIEAHHSGHIFLVSNVHDVAICGVTIRGQWIEGVGDDSALLGAGIQIQESSTVSVDGVTIRNMLGRGVVVASNVDRVRIRNCEMAYCAISVFFFKGITYGRVEACHIYDSRILGICIDDATEGDTQETANPCQHNIISGNMVIRGGTSAKNIGFGIAVSGSTDTVISNNIVRCFGSEDRDGHGIVLNNGQRGFHQGRRTIVSGNILSDHSGYGLYCMKQESCVESGNVYSGNRLGDRNIV